MNVPALTWLGVVYLMQEAQRMEVTWLTIVNSFINNLPALVVALGGMVAGFAALWVKVQKVEVSTNGIVKAHIESTKDKNKMLGYMDGVADEQARAENAHQGGRSTDQTQEK